MLAPFPLGAGVATQELHPSSLCGESSRLPLYARRVRAWWVPAFAGATPRRDGRGGMGAGCALCPELI